MQRNRRPFKLVPIFIFSFIAILYITHTYPPAWKLDTGYWKLDILYLFFISLFLFLSTFFAFFLNHIRRGFFLGLLITSYLFTRFLGLHHPFFPLTLLAIFLALELVFSRKHQ